MTPKSDLSGQEIEDAVARVVASDELGGARRLKSLLEYVAAEHLAGRGDEILGKTIGMDVYGREPDAHGDGESIVRVDASRLRRRLDDYYAGSGRSDPVRVSVPKGGYAPVFERRSDIEAPAPRPRPPGRAGIAIRPVALAAGLGVLALAVALFLFLRVPTPPGFPEDIPSEELATLLELSPRALQARDLAEDAKVLVFPATEAERVFAASIAFERAMELDPNYYGGFAGASQTAAILAGLADTPEEAQDLIVRSRELAETAFLLDPEAAWSLSAMAWIAFLSRDFETASQFSARATTLSDEDPYIFGFDVIISVFSGEFRRAIENASSGIHSGRQEFRFPWRTAQANAWYHLGEYRRAIALFEEGAAHGDGVGEVNLGHMIASYQALGMTEKAAAMVEAFEGAWPDSRISSLLPALFRDEAHARSVLTQMRAAGWVAPTETQAGAGYGVTGE